MLHTGALRVLTYATKATPMLCDCLLVALRARVPLTLIGFGEAYHGNFQKLTGARDVVASLPRDTLVLFADAYDVLYSAGADALRDGFAALRVPPSRVLFMGERGCWPDWDMGPPGRRFCLQAYPNSTTPYRYVNSGVWMGRAAAALRLLTVLASCAPCVPTHDSARAHAHRALTMTHPSPPAPPWPLLMCGGCCMRGQTRRASTTST